MQFLKRILAQNQEKRKPLMRAAFLFLTENEHMNTKLSKLQRTILFSLPSDGSWFQWSRRPNYHGSEPRKWKTRKGYWTISKWSCSEHAAMSKSVTRLEDRGLVKTHRAHGYSRRGKIEMIHLTEEGQEVIKRISPPADILTNNKAGSEANAKKVLESLTPEQIEARERFSRAFGKGSNG